MAGETSYSAWGNNYINVLPAQGRTRPSALSRYQQAQKGTDRQLLCHMV